MGTDVKTYSHTLHRESLKHTSLNGIFSLDSSPQLREPHGREKAERVQDPKGWRAPEQDALNQLSKVHMNSQGQKQQAHGLHRSTPEPLCLYYRF